MDFLILMLGLWGLDVQRGCCMHVSLIYFLFLLLYCSINAVYYCEQESRLGRLHV
jgi:hypothetical protein